MCASSRGRKKGHVECTTTQRDLFDHSVSDHVAARNTLCCTTLVESKRHTMESRQLKALEIAATSSITQSGDLWLVPSQSKAATYAVRLSPFSCTCPDFEKMQQACKHLLAVLEHIRQSATGQPIPYARTLSENQPTSRSGTNTISRKSTRDPSCNPCSPNSAGTSKNPYRLWGGLALR
jgi:hypothetical protein